MNDLLSGAQVMAFWAAGLFFVRFWTRTRDRLFAFFALAFWLLGGTRVALTVLREQHEQGSYLYVVRLLAFLLILVGIFDKNRQRKPSSPPEQSRDSIPSA